MDEEEEVAPLVDKVEEPPPPRRRPKPLFIPKRAASVVEPPREVKFITPDKTTCAKCVCFPTEDPYVRRNGAVLSHSHSIHVPPPPRRRRKPLFIPKRAPSIVEPPREVKFITPDKTICAKCVCFPKEDPYVRSKKQNPCLKSPELLYELAARAVDTLTFPEAFKWTEEEVADWMVGVGFPEYRECILDNHINGLRLLLLEDPSHFPQINIRDFGHIKLITSKVKELFNTEYIKFARSIGLPPRKPFTHCTLFKSRTGPSWGIRQNWTPCDILRWMNILKPEPLHLDHWDLVWYTQPEFPKERFARIDKHVSERIPHYTSQEDICNEYLVPRKFRLQTGIPENAQMIWMEHLPGSAKLRPPVSVKVKPRIPIPKKSRLDPPKVILKGAKGVALVLARRKMPKQKFMSHYY